MISQLVQTWHMGCEVNLYLLDNIAEEFLADRYSARTRTVAAQFAHMHNVRLRWLRHAAPKLVGDVQSFPKGAQSSKSELKEALQASEKIISAFLEECEAAGKVNKWNGPPATLLGYMIAHEAHHRGLAMVAMRIAGHKLLPEIVYDLWQWGKKRK